MFPKLANGSWGLPEQNMTWWTQWTENKENLPDSLVHPISLTSGFASGPAGEPSHTHRLPQGGRLCVRHLTAGCHGAFSLRSTCHRLGESQPEQSLWTSAHRILHADSSHALRTRQLALLPHRDPIREAGWRCATVGLLFRCQESGSSDRVSLKRPTIPAITGGRDRTSRKRVSHT